MYIDDKLTLQNQNISNNISFGNTIPGFRTPSTNFLPYVINSDFSVSYTEQEKLINISCSETSNIMNLYEIAQPYNTTNELSFSGYTRTSGIQTGLYETLDTQHTSGPDLDTIYYYGVWFEYDFSNLGGISFSKVLLNIPDFSQSPNSFIVLGTNDHVTWYSLISDFNFDFLANQTLSHIYTCATYPSPFQYVRVVLEKAQNNNNINISGIQFIQENSVYATNFGTGTNSQVSLGSFTSPLQLRYSSIYKNLGTTSSDIILDTDLDNTFPPTSTALNKSITANVATQLYNAIPATTTTTKVYFRYTGTLTLTTSQAFQQLIVSGMTLQSSPQNLNGLSISTIVNTTTNTLTIPYNGIWCISANYTALTTGFIVGFRLTSTSGTYGTATLNAGFSGAGGSAGMAYTNFFAANDTFTIQWSGYSQTSYPLSWHLVLISKY